MSVASALDAFVARYLDRFPRLVELYDADWRSPCEIGEPFGSPPNIAWQPLLRGGGPWDDFAGLERALETPIHPDIKAYYGRYWSGGLEASAPDGHVSLILLWNPQDAERLIENLIGHALLQRRARCPFNVFFACTDADSEYFLTVDNDSGRVLLEQPGRKPLRTVADDLESFLNTLTPAAPELHPERASLR